MGISDPAIAPSMTASAFLTPEILAPSLSALVSTFLVARKAAGRAPATISWYDARLRRLVDFLGDPAPRAISTAQLRAFLVRVKQGTAGRPPARDSYVEGHRKAIAALFTWARNERAIGRSPARALPRFRSDRRLPDVYAQDDVAALIDAEPDTRAGARNRALVALMYDTGIRVGELVAILLSDLDFERGELRVRGKSRRERVVPLSPTVRGAILAYLQRARPPELFATSARLFLGRDRRPLTTNAVRLLLRRMRLRAGIGVHLHPHGFRSTFATQYLRNGGDPYTAQAIMGIRSATVMAGYVNMALSDVHAKHAAASPLERMLSRR